MPEDSQPEFPKGFLWGASTSGHQVDGGLNNQWTVWEKANAQKLAASAERLYGWLPNWNDIKDQAQSPENYISGKGVEHYTRYKEDFALVKKLNLNAFRFSIEWDRLEPECGQWNQGAIEHFHAYIDELNRLGIEPILNIWHWTMPLWFTKRGGFTKKSNVKYFVNFVNKISEEYGHKLRYIITLNEPNNFTSLGYLVGVWPPQKKNPWLALRVYRNLVHAHKLAYRALKEAHPSLQVGMAAHLANIQAKDPHDFSDELSTKLMRYGWNWWFLFRIKKQQDFIGMNYYLTDYYDGWFRRRNPKMPVSDLGWYMEPEGLYPLLLRAWKHFNKPIIVTENGVADAHDEYRRWWLEETIVAMERAISEGVRIVGYLHWSLLDNFEWAQGWWPKFGLIEVDRRHGMERKIRPSAKWFAEQIAKLSASK